MKEVVALPDRNSGVSQDILQEQNVGLHATDVKLIESSLHLLDCMQIGVPSADDLQQQTTGCSL